MWRLRSSRLDVQTFGRPTSFSDAWTPRRLKPLRAPRWIRMNIVDPMHLFGIWLDVRQVEIDDDGILTAATQHTRQRLGVARVDLLVRDGRWHIDEVPWPCLGE